MNCSSHFDSLESDSETDFSPTNHQSSSQDHRFPRTLTIRRNQLYDANNVPSNRHNQGSKILDSEPNPHSQSSDHVKSAGRGLSRNGHTLKGIASAKRGESEQRSDAANVPKGIRETISSMVTSFKTVFHIGTSTREQRIQASNILNNNSKASFLDNDNSRKGRAPKTNKDGRRSTNLRSYQRFGTRGGVRPIPLGTTNRKFYDKLPITDDANLSPSREEASAIASPMSIDTTTIASTSTPASEFFDNNFLEQWDEEELTCQVCDRSFATPNLLERHQQKRRHWG